MTKFPDKVRLLVQFGKFPVVSVNKGSFGTEFTLSMPGGVKIKADLGIRADVRVGDHLTLFTEVLADDEPRDKPTN